MCVTICCRNKYWGNMITENKEIFVSVDVEFDGENPNKNSLLSIGAVAYSDDPTSKNGYSEVSRFYTNFKPLQGHSPSEDTTNNFWNLPENSEALKLLQVDKKEPQEAMESFSSWVNSLDGKPSLIAFPLEIEEKWLSHYINETGISLPFVAGIDIKEYLSETEKLLPHDQEHLREEWQSKHPYTHNALDDATQQGETFMNVRAWKLKHETPETEVTHSEENLIIRNLKLHMASKLHDNIANNPPPLREADKVFFGGGMSLSLREFYGDIKFPVVRVPSDLDVGFYQKDPMQGIDGQKIALNFMINAAKDEGFEVTIKSRENGKEHSNKASPKRDKVFASAEFTPENILKICNDDIEKGKISPDAVFLNVKITMEIESTPVHMNFLPPVANIRDSIDDVSKDILFSDARDVLAAKIARVLVEGVGRQNDIAAITNIIHAKPLTFDAKMAYIDPNSPDSDVDLLRVLTILQLPYHLEDPAGPTIDSITPGAYNVQALERNLNRDTDIVYLKTEHGLSKSADDDFAAMLLDNLLDVVDALFPEKEKNRLKFSENELQFLEKAVVERNFDPTPLIKEHQKVFDKYPELLKNVTQDIGHSK
jgi:hypothetical protein